MPRWRPLDYLYCDYAPSHGACDRSELVSLARRFELPRFASLLEIKSYTTSSEAEGRYVKQDGKWILDTKENRCGLEEAGMKKIPPSTFYQDMLGLQHGGDLVLNLNSDDGKTMNVPAWRSLLCEVEYFRALLDSGFREAAQTAVVVNVIDCDAAATAIRYLHTGDRRRESYNGEVEPETVAAIADLFGVADLVEVADMWTMSAEAVSAESACGTQTGHANL